MNPIRNPRGHRSFNRPLLIAAFMALLARTAPAQTGPLFYRTDYYPMWPEPNGLLYADPSGLVVADFNHDGRPDFAVANASGVTLFLGTGDGSFQSPMLIDTTINAGLLGPLAAADFDGDGNIDLVVWFGSIVLLPGNGDGTFRPSRQIAPAGLNGPIGIPYINGALGVADLNHDGHPDLVVLVAGGTIGSAKSNATVLLNNGNGTFSSHVAVEIPTNESAVGLAIADFNRDGRPDLAVLTEVLSGPGFVSNSNLYVAFGNGDGSFASPLSSSIGHWSSFITAGDFNNDGASDLAVETLGGFTTSILLGNGDGTFRAAPDLSIGEGNPGMIAVADFNGDGKLDIAVASNGLPQGVALAAGNGDGTFQPGEILQFGGIFSPWQIVAADLNGDGRADMVVSATDSSSTSVTSVFLNAGVPPPVIAASAASGVTTVAPASIAAVYGTSLAATTQSIGSLPIPLDIGGVSVNILDSAGASRPAPLFYVSPAQINLEIPAGTASGVAVVTVDNNGVSMTGGAFVQNVAPGIFGYSGFAAAYALTYGPGNQAQPPLLVTSCQSNGCSPVPIPIPAGSRVFLELFGAGIRNHVSPVVCFVFGQSLPVTYAGAQGVLEGLDQVNVEITNLAHQPPGTYFELILTVDGRASNIVTFQVQ